MPIRKFRKEDRDAIVKLVKATNVFRPEEVEVATELLDAAVHDPHQKDYIVYSYEDEGGAVQGYYCVGPTPMTASTFDLYWIAVHPHAHGKGMGYELLMHCEQHVKAMGGTLLMVETSSLPKYEATRWFYTRNNYHEASRVKDYYAPGDDLVVYTKHI